MVFFPKRLLTEDRDTFCFSSGARCAAISSKRCNLAFCLVERACAPRRTHSNSLRKKFCRFRSAAANSSSRSAFISRYFV